MDKRSKMMETFKYKDLEIGFTSNFALMWDDKGSGGKYNGSYWRPIIPEEMPGFYALGDLGQAGYADIRGKAAIAIVKDVNGESGTALRPPLKFEEIWKDKGSGANKNGSMWRPIPPDGYVAMGLVCNMNWGAPQLDVVRCVRADLVVPAFPGSLIWDDTKTGSDRDFGSWRIEAPSAPSGEVFLSPGTFIGRASHAKPTKDSNAYALRLPIPQQVPPNPMPLAPLLKGYSKPLDFEEDSVSYLSVLPWFTVSDPNLTPVEQMVKSPHYCLERVDRYKLIDFGYNRTSTPQTFSWAVTTGVSGSESKTFSSTTSIEFGAEWKVSAVFSLSAKLTQSFTYSETSTKGWEQATTKTVNVTVPPNKAVAVYSIQSTYRLFRANGEQVSTNVGYNLGDNLYWTEYPPTPDMQVKIKEAAPKKT
jgi:hypothetical protein